MSGPRRALCITCRTLLQPDEPCDGGKRHRVVTLNKPGHDALVEAVWGPPSKRHQHKAAVKAGTGGGILGGITDCGGLADGCAAGCEGGPEGLAIIAAIVIAAGIAVALYYLIAWIVRRVRAYRNRPRPVGAAGSSKRLSGRGIEGTVRATTTGASPLQGADCAAWAIKLVAKRASHGNVMLRAAQTTGFEVELDDGRRAHVPAGRIRLAPSRHAADIDRSTLERFLCDVDPRYTAAEGETPFPFDRGYEALVHDGDRVVLLGSLEPAFDRDAPASYREAATRLQFAAVPALRLVDRN